MRMVCISRSNDIAIGLRLAGVQSFFIRDENKIKEKIIELSKDADVGILNVTEEVFEIAKAELDKISKEQDLPLVVKIPNSK